MIGLGNNRRLWLAGRAIAGTLLAISVYTAAPAVALPAIVSVHLFEAHGRLGNVTIKAPLEVLNVNRFIRPGSAFTVRAAADSVELIDQRSGAISTRVPSLHVRGLGRDGLSICLGATCRTYRGSVVFTSKKGTLEIINEIPALDYVTSVVGSETLPNWPVEMLKAQAVITQTRLFRHKADDFLGDSTNKEVYLGSAYERPPVRRAVRSVWGKALTFRGTPAMPLYHSTCAGGTSDGAQYFGKKLGGVPYLATVKCDFCQPSPFFKPLTKSIPLSLFERSFPTVAPAVTQRDGAGRPLLLQFKDGTQASGYDFWLKFGQRLGWDKVPGTRYQLSATGSALSVTSTGAGHGVGLCQWGAAGLARRGRSYSDILKYYYPGTSLARQ
jgi:stage II sporulation protein D